MRGLLNKKKKEKGKKEKKNRNEKQEEDGRINEQEAPRRTKSCARDRIRRAYASTIIPEGCRPQMICFFITFAPL